LASRSLLQQLRLRSRIIIHRPSISQGAIDAGQQFEYLKTQMRGFKAQTRADLDGNMTSAAQALTDKDIDVLVDYISGLGAP
jgi:cytochrome c553